MTITTIADVEFGAQLPVFTPDTGMDTVRRFARAAGWDRPRFTNHEAARAEGLPGALVPGIMSQGFLAAMIHRWAPDAQVTNIAASLEPTVTVVRCLMTRSSMTRPCCTMPTRMTRGPEPTRTARITAVI